MSFKDKLVGLLSEEEDEVVKENKDIKKKGEVDEEEVEIDLKETFNTLKKLLQKEYFYYVLLIPVLITGLWIRLRNMSVLKGKYLMGLDPYYFYRLAGYILEHGRLMEIDYMKFAPLGAKVNFRLFPYFLAAWHKVASVFTGQPQIYSHVIYPPIFAIIGFFFFFLLVREIFDNRVALVATAFFAVVPGYLYRTLAGFADHETFAMLLLFASLWLFVKFRKEEEIKKKILFASLSGFLGSLMALTWPGVALLTISVFLFVTFEILFERIDKKYFLGYTLWTILFSLPVLLLKGATKLRSINVVFIYFPFLVFLVYYVLKRIKFLKIKKISLSIQSLIFSGIISLIVIFLFYDINFISRIITNPGGAARISRTTSEIIGGVNLWGTFNWILIFAIFGVLYLVYASFKKNKKEILVMAPIILISSVVLLLIKTSEDIRLISLSITLVLIALMYIYSYYKYGKDSRFICKSNLIYLLPLFIFLVSAYLSKTAARFVFVFSPFVCLMAAYFLVSLGKELYSRKNLRLTSILILIVIFGLFFMNADASAKQAENTGSHLPGAWENSMLWLRDNTPEGSIVSHWWDYGYWTQAVAERPSTQDGGKPGGSFFIYNLARYGMVAYDDTEALTYFKTNKVSYLLYSWEEIGKYHAFSYLASHKGPPGKYDRESTIGSFILAQQKEIRNGTLHVYQGGWAFDQDIVIDDLVLPENKAGVGAFLITLGKNDTIIKPPEVIMVYNNQQFTDKIGCAYINGVKQTWDVNSSLDACIVFVDYFPNQQQKVENGAIIFLSSKVRRGLFARLYITGEEIEGFEQVYSGSTPLGVFKNRVIGPIKIWKINYPENITEDPDRFHKEPEDFYDWYGY